MMSRPLTWLLLLLCFGASHALAVEQPAGPKPTAEQLEFFEKRIRPVLVSQCYQCHSAQSAQIKGGLLLDTRAGVEKGGESGPVVIAGQPDESPLIRALRYADDAPAMPPRKQLSDEVIADFAKWVSWGAPDPREGATVTIQHGIDIEKGRTFWSFVPLRDTPPPPVKDGAWPRSPIDHYILAGLEREQLTPNPDADLPTLIRRLHIDLTGLMPTEDKLQAEHKALLKAATSRDSAAFSSQLSALLDSLLASPSFGERWARHWLDVARFAETSGRQINFNYPHAWRYRDWVIQAFHKDLPYDQFILQQLAGDLLPAANDEQRAAQLIATGFLALGPKAHAEREPTQFQLDVIDEQIDVTTQAFLGLTVACARCHDHKFDPIPQRDYYALAGIFRSTETCFGTVRIIQNVNPTPLVQLPAEARVASALPRLSSDEFALLKQKQLDTKRSFDDKTAAGKPTTGVEFNAVGTLTAKVSNYHDDGTPKLQAMGVRERERIGDCPLYDRGEIDKPGDTVPRGVVQVVSKSAVAVPNQASGRLELARWIASRDNPLTARVIVNRVWTQLFGRGLVPTPDNFGAAGMAPDHPELLDHLALSLMNDGWSLKRLIRRIVLSRAYQLSSRHQAANFERDPDNARVWRMSPRRIDAEVLRDSLLSIAGRLELTPPIGSPVALAGEDNSNTLLRKLAALDSAHVHRAVYLPVIRDSVVESLALFDFADPSLVVSQRTTTTVPAQSLYLLNSPWVQSQVEATAARLLSTGEADDAARVARAYRWFLAREPSTAERQLAEKFLHDYAQAIQGERMSGEKRRVALWAAFCQGLVASADFLYRN